MDLLLDTHSLLWLAAGDGKRLSVMSRQLIEDNENTKYVSMATFWEIAIKLIIRKLELKKGFISIVEFVKDAGFQIISISIEQIEIVKDLPLLHRDPFDRILIAQAENRNLTIVTVDKNIKLYNIKTIW